VRNLNDLELLFLLLAAASLGIALVLWRLWSRMLRHASRRRHAGYQLMDALKAYTAWIDWHRDEPELHQAPDAVGIPAALAKAKEIQDLHFPEMSRLMHKLLHTHRQLMQYLWEDSILRTTQAPNLRPHYADPRYHQLRDTQDAALDSLFVRCRERIGETESGWRRTRSDFSFSSPMSGGRSGPASS
jgi:hypothetical protein